MLRPYQYRASFPSQQYTVGDEIQSQHERAQHRLRRSGEPGRIERRNHIMLDESAAVPFEPRAFAQRVLEGGERTDPAAVLDGDSPHRARDVYQGDPAPAPHEERAQHHESDEGYVQEHDTIGEDAVEHLQAPLIRRKLPPDQGPVGVCINVAPFRRPSDSGTGRTDSRTRTRWPRVARTDPGTPGPPPPRAGCRRCGGP